MESSNISIVQVAGLCLLKHKLWLGTDGYDTKPIGDGYCRKYVLLLIIY